MCSSSVLYLFSAVPVTLQAATTKYHNTHTDRYETNCKCCLQCAYLFKVDVAFKSSYLYEIFPV